MKRKEISQISKSVWMMIEHAKDLSAQNLALAISRGDMTVSERELPKVLSLVKASIEQSYLQMAPSFEKSLEKTLDEVAIKNENAKK